MANPARPFTDFVLYLCDHTDAIKKFFQDPGQLDGFAGLNKEQKAALLSRDSVKINEAIEDECGVGGGGGGIKKVLVLHETWTAIDQYKKK